MAATASAFVIRELTGDKRTFTFTGRGLPYPPFTLSGTQRHDITWYGGSPEGTLQVQGAKEDETTVNGMWKDRFLRQVGSMSPIEQANSGFVDAAFAGGFADQTKVAGQQGSSGATINGEPISSVRFLSDEIDDVRRKGQLVEVTWMHIKRRGLLASFRQSWEDVQDVAWEIRFVWINQGSQLAEVPVQDSSVDLSDALSDFSTQLDILKDFIDNPTALNLNLNATAAGRALEIVNDLLDLLEQALDKFQNVIIVNTQALLSPISTAQRAFSILEFIKQTANSISDSIALHLDSGVLNADIDFGTRLDQRNSLATQRRASRSMSSTASIRQAQLLTKIQPELINAFTAREGQDLRDVALQHYGRIDDWRALLAFNNLSTSRLSANQLIFVPRTPPQVEAC